MGAGEYVSVSSQSRQRACRPCARETGTGDDAGREHRELAGIYVQRGLSPALAEQVATELAAHDALAAHARDELGITEHNRAQPITAALVSTASFAAGCRRAAGVDGAGFRPCAGKGRVHRRAGAAGRAGRRGGQTGWRTLEAGSHARGVLGRSGHGRHRADRSRIRRERSADERRRRAPFRSATRTRWRRGATGAGGQGDVPGKLCAPAAGRGHPRAHGAKPRARRVWRNGFPIRDFTCGWWKPDRARRRWATWP